MKSVSLLYHDIVEPGQFHASGFSSPDADIYKLDVLEFRRHLEGINRRGVPASNRLFTFDDGGASALEPTATLLEAFGWRGSFFITTDFIGTRGFLTRTEIRTLRARGHVVGSHSCSHPARMALCSHDQLLHEWGDSRELLSDILGEAVESASVPGGYYARRVAEAASECGIRVLFTSEPTSSTHDVAGTEVVGRYSIQQGVSAKTAAAIASGDVMPRVRQAAFWNAKKAMKTVGGRQWLRLRKYLIARRAR